MKFNCILRKGKASRANWHKPRPTLVGRAINRSSAVSDDKIIGPHYWPILMHSRSSAKWRARIVTYDDPISLLRTRIRSISFAFPLSSACVVSTSQDIQPVACLWSRAKRPSGPEYLTRPVNGGVHCLSAVDCT